MTAANKKKIKILILYKSTPPPKKNPRNCHVMLGNVQYAGWWKLVTYEIRKTMPNNGQLS